MFDQHVIETPENIAFDYQVAGIGSRFLAILVDTIIQGALYLVLITFYIIILMVSEIDRLTADVEWLPAVIALVTLFVIQFGYFIIFEITLGGRSPGKQLAGLRVIKENGQPLSALDSIIRNLLRIIDFLPFGYGVGIITMFFNPRSKRLGDFAAGTLVVRAGKSVKLSDLQRPRAAPGPLADYDVRLKESDIELVESYLQRRASLVNADALGAEIAQRIRTRLALPETEAARDPKSATAFLEQVVAAYRAKQSNR